MSGFRDRFIRKEFQFFRDRAKSGKSFTFDEFKTMSGRKQKSDSWDDYLHKKWMQFLNKGPDGKFTVRKDFLYVDPDDFASVYRQAERLYANYDLTVYDHVLTYEFFLPLTHERKLRRSLDNLFYEDGLRQRLYEVGKEPLAKMLKNKKDSLEALIEKALLVIGSNFGGYSIHHVSGRFRARDLQTRDEAAKLIATGRDYIIDETTAIVRFIFPLGNATDSEGYAPSKIPQVLSAEHDDNEIHEKVLQLRQLFASVFVDAVVRTVRYEDEIWILESGFGNRLWKLVAKKDHQVDDPDTWYDSKS